MATRYAELVETIGRVVNSPAEQPALSDRCLREAAAAITALEARCERLENALTPTGATKAAYMGEFQFSMEVWNPEGGEDGEGEVAIEQVTVPWTTIKQIMAAISRAASIEPKP